MLSPSWVQQKLLLKSPGALDMSYILKVIIATISVKIAELSL